jgi:hypothetical protein
MKIQEKIRRYKKHYKVGSVLQRTRIENMVREEVDKDPDKAMLWTELVFGEEPVFSTILEKKAEHRAKMNNIQFYKIVKGGIKPC